MMNEKKFMKHYDCVCERAGNKTRTPSVVFFPHVIIDFDAVEREATLVKQELQYGWQDLALSRKWARQYTSVI